MSEGEIAEGASAGTVVLSYRAMAEFRHALAAYEHESAMIVRKAGLTPKQFSCLVAVGGQPGEKMSVGDVAKELYLTPHAAVELTQRAEAAGLVKRVADPRSGRRVLLVLTPFGRSTLDRLLTEHLEQLAGARATLIHTLKRWNDQLATLRRG